MSVEVVTGEFYRGEECEDDYREQIDGHHGLVDGVSAPDNPGCSCVSFVRGADEVVTEVRRRDA